MKAEGRRWLTARATLGVALMCACVTASIAKPSANETKRADSVLTVTDADNGKDIDITSGQILQVKLKSNAGTGYAWTLSGDPAPLKLIKTSTQHSKNTSGKAGAPQMSVFQLQATSAGLTNLTFVYRRSWEFNVPPAKTFSIRVNVR